MVTVNSINEDIRDVLSESSLSFELFGESDRFYDRSTERYMTMILNNSYDYQIVTIDYEHDIQLFHLVGDIDYDESTTDSPYSRQAQANYTLVCVLKSKNHIDAILSLLYNNEDIVISRIKRSTFENMKEYLHLEPDRIDDKNSDALPLHFSCIAIEYKLKIDYEMQPCQSPCEILSNNKDERC